MLRKADLIREMARSGPRIEQVIQANEHLIDDEFLGLLKGRADMAEGSALLFLVASDIQRCCCSITHSADALHFLVAVELSRMIWCSVARCIHVPLQSHMLSVLTSGNSCSVL